MAIGTNSAHRLIRIGTAGWGIPKSSRDRFPKDGSTLERYARIFNCTEINSTFYRSHRPSTYERWARSVPDEFAFSVKMPKEITHVRKLVDCAELVRRFLDETAALGEKRDVVLVQLPPKLNCEQRQAEEFFGVLRSLYRGPVVFEPRHPSWFAESVSRWLASIGICRVAADPAIIPEAAVPGAGGARTYFRLHGSPRTYYSSYADDTLEGIAHALEAAPQPWCIFDNTAGGAAAGDAIRLLNFLAPDK